MNQKKRSFLKKSSPPQLLSPQEQMEETEFLEYMLTSLRENRSIAVFKERKLYLFHPKPSLVIPQGSNGLRDLALSLVRKFDRRKNPCSEALKSQKSWTIRINPSDEAQSMF